MRSSHPCAAQVRDRLLCADCLANYFQVLVQEMRDHFLLASVLDNKFRLHRLLERLDFRRLNLVELEVVDHEYVRTRYITTRSRLLDLSKLATHRAKNVSRADWNDQRPERDWDELVTGTWALELNAGAKRRKHAARMAKRRTKRKNRAEKKKKKNSGL